MNIFQYLDLYVQQQGNTFGSINNKEECLKQMLTRDEQQIYEQIKKSDRERLIKYS